MSTLKVFFNILWLYSNEFFFLDFITTDREIFDEKKDFVVHVTCYIYIVCGQQGISLKIRAFRQKCCFILIRFLA